MSVRTKGKNAVHGSGMTTMEEVKADAASWRAGVEQVSALHDKVRAHLGALAVVDKRHASKGRPQLEQEAGELQALAVRFELPVRGGTFEAIAADRALLDELAPLQGAVASLGTTIDGVAFAVRSRSVDKVLDLYAALRRASRKDPQLAAALAPIVARIALGKKGSARRVVAEGAANARKELRRRRALAVLAETQAPAAMAAKGAAAA